MVGRMETEAVGREFRGRQMVVRWFLESKDLVSCDREYFRMILNNAPGVVHIVLVVVVVPVEIF